MIKSSKVTTRYVNSCKQNELNTLVDEYQRVMGFFINLLWSVDKVPVLLDHTYTSQVDSWLTARMVQCAGKQASGIVRGTNRKQNQRKFMITKLHNSGRHKQARKLQHIYDKVTLSKPTLHIVNPELDSRFIKIDLDPITSFDGWVTIGSIGKKIKITIPFKRNAHFNKMNDLGSIKSGIRLSKTSMTFMFDIPDVDIKTSGDTLGIDIGKTNVIACSNRHISNKNQHGHDLNTILLKMSKKIKGSKAFTKCEAHRKNYINWSINQLNLDSIKEVRLEKIQNLRKNKKTNRILSHWTYTEIFDKLESRCEEQGVLVTRINPTYTSQRCSKCGWTRKRNRKGKLFKCSSCGHSDDADLNAAMNIALNIPQISEGKRLMNSNRTGFYWNTKGQDHIVPAVNN